MRIFRWGILAPGRIAQKFAADLALLDGDRLLGVGSSNLARAQAFADRFGIPQAFGDYVEMLDKVRPDIAYIAAPHAMHYDLARACLDRNVSVLCEKPACLNAPQLESLLTLAANKGCFFMEALWTLFLPAIQQIQRLLYEGELGKVHTVRADFGFYTPRQPDSRLFNPLLGGGSLLDIGIYPLLLANVCLGTPERILAQGSLTPEGIDDECMVQLSFPCGGMAQIHASLRSDTPTEACIHGDKGSIHIPARWIDFPGFTWTKPGLGSQEVRCPREGFGYHYQVLEAEKCLAAGRISSMVASHKLSLKLMRQMDEIRRQIGVVYPQDTQLPA